MTSRRTFLAGLAVGSAAVGVGRPGIPSDPAAETALREARRQAVQRRRRVIFNNDGDDIWAAGTETRERFLATRHVPLLGTQVDSIHYCTTQSFNLFTHQTEVAEVFAARSGRFADNHLEKHLSRGTDGLRMSSEFAHEHGLESIWTLRMNDIHDAWTPEFLPQWKRADPTRTMSTQTEAKDFQDRRRLWSLVDYEHPDVVPRLLEIVEEVLVNYTVDGVELDFLRAPCYFRTTYAGQAATEHQTAILTQLVRAIRKLVLRESRRQERPLLLLARVPVSLELGSRVGIDTAGWLRESLIDVLTVGGGYLTFDLPIQPLVELAHERGVPVYPCLSQSGLLYRPPRGSSTRQPPAAWFGAAARLWEDGADGIYTFNLFPGPGTADDRAFARQILQTIGSPELLSERTIMYAISDAGWWMPSHYWAKDVVDVRGALPLRLVAGEYNRTSLYVSDDLRGAGFDVTAELRVDFAGLPAGSAPEILFGSANFGPTDGGQQVGQIRRYVCPVPVQSIRQGANRVMVKTSVEGARLAGAELWIHR